MSVIDPATTTVIETITESGSLTGSVAVSPTGPEAGDVYVANYYYTDNNVLVIS